MGGELINTDDFDIPIDPEDDIPEVRRDPSRLSYPATLPIEVALRTATPENIRQAYGFSHEEWENLRHDKRFLADLEAANEMLKKEGMSFKLKAALQADELLKTSWNMIHDASGKVPPSVRADLLKFTIRCAGLEAGPKDDKGFQNNLQININLV